MFRNVRKDQNAKGPKIFVLYFKAQIGQSFEYKQCVYQEHIKRQQFQEASQHKQFVLFKVYPRIKSHVPASLCVPGRYLYKIVFTEKTFCESGAYGTSSPCCRLFLTSCCPCQASNLKNGRYFVSSAVILFERVQWP